MVMRQSPTATHVYLTSTLEPFSGTGEFCTVEVVAFEMTRFAGTRLLRGNGPRVEMVDRGAMRIKEWRYNGAIRKRHLSHN